MPMRFQSGFCATRCYHNVMPNPCQYYIRKCSDNLDQSGIGIIVVNAAVKLLANIFTSSFSGWLCGRPEIYASAIYCRI